MEKSSLKNQLEKATALYALNIQRTSFILPIGLFFVILAQFTESKEWLTQYGLIVMSVAILFWCNATRHLLKYIKIKRLTKEKKDK